MSDDTTTTRDILRCFDEGDLAGAERLCHEALARDPGDPAVLHLMGLWELERRNARGAIALISRSLERAPHDIVALENLGLAHLAAADPVAAEAAFRRALDAGAAHASLQMRLGLALGEQGRYFEAEAALRTAAHLAPEVPDVHLNLGSLLGMQGRTNEALECLRRVIALAPDYVDAHFNTGALLLRESRFAEAEPAYRKVLALAPDYADAHNNLGIVCDHTGRLDEAVSCFRAAAAADPRHVHALSNLGKALCERGELADAEQSCLQALELDPGFAEARVNLAGVRVEQGRYQEARREYERSLEAAPADEEGQLSYAKLCLAQGDFRTGWPAYQWRPARLAAYERNLAVPDASPDAVASKRVLLIGEQGMDYELLFLRYASLLKSRGARVACQCDARIVGMLRRTHMFETIVPHGQAAPSCDVGYLVGDLPLALGAELPVPAPLRMEAVDTRVTKLRRRLAALGPPPWIGIEWRASPVSEGQAAPVHAPRPEEIDPLLIAGALAGVKGTVVVVQHEPRAEEIAALNAAVPGRVHDLSAVNADLEETLALLSLLSEYVGVSNTHMHLMAGVGGSARVLVPHPPEWRWMLEGAVSPWFPGFRVYRQAAGGDWSAALTSLAADLGQTLAGDAPGPRSA